MATSESIKLNMLGLPVIQSVDDFSELTRISKYTIYQLSTHSDKYYKTYTIPKKSGKPRLICQPCKKLKGLQAWILYNILDRLKVSPFCKGFEKGSSTAHNAQPHIGANTILTLDLKDFFPSVKRKYVYNIFHSVGYNRTVSTIFTNICIYNDGLPQGSPCSPRLANLAAWRLDMRIQGYVGKRGITYTRYADDLTISGLNPTKVVRTIPMIKSIIANENFEVNNDKTRVAGASRKRKVTGLVLTNETFGIGKEKYKSVRAKIHHLTLKKEQKNIKLLNEVRGWLSYLNSVDKKSLLKAKEYIAKLQDNYPKTIITRIKI